MFLICTHFSILCDGLCLFQCCESTCRLSPARGALCDFLIFFLWMEGLLCCDGRMDEWEGIDEQMNGRDERDACGEAGRGGGCTSHYVSAVHQGNWSVCDSYRQDGQREGRGRRRQRWRGCGEEGDGGLFLSYLPLFFFFFQYSIPHQWCSTGDLFSTGRKPSLPPSHSASPPSSLCLSFAQLTAWMHEWTGLSLLLLQWGEEGLHRKLWGRGEGERMSDKEKRGGGERVPIASQQIHTDCWSHPLHRKLLPWRADQSIHLCRCTYSCISYEWMRYN